MNNQLITLYAFTKLIFIFSSLLCVCFPSVFARLRLLACYFDTLGNVFYMNELSLECIHYRPKKGAK